MTLKLTLCQYPPDYRVMDHNGAIYDLSPDPAKAAEIRDLLAKSSVFADYTIHRERLEQVMDLLKPFKI